MRRRIVAAVLALCLLLGGCAGRRIRAEDLDFTFDCIVDVSAPAGNLKCSFRRTGAQNATVRVLEGGPQGLSFCWSGGGFSQTYLGLAAEHETCVLPRDSFAAVLVETLDGAEKRGALTGTRDNEFSGKAVYDFTLTADPETGKILTLSVPECGFRAEFRAAARQTVETETAADIGTVPD